MRFWMREIAGWALLLLGLYVFYQCYARLLTHDSHYILEGGALSIVGIVIFRGGIHLLKIALAARVVLGAHAEPERAPSRPSGTQVHRTDRPIASRRLP